MSSYCFPNQKFIFNDEQIFLKKLKKMPDDKRMYLSASATVEASLVIPLFVFAVMAVAYLIQIVGLQVKVQQALYNECRKMAKYVYAYEMFGKEGPSDGQSQSLEAAEEKNGKNKGYHEILTNGIGIGVAETLLISELGVDYIENSHVVGGVAGFNMMNSKFMDQNNMIDIVVTYAVKNPFDIFGIGVMTFTQRASSCAWVGDRENRDGKESGTDPAETYVYITPSGTVYHTDRNCSCLVLSIHEISADNLADARNDSGGKYYICEKCNEKDNDGIYFITDYGDRYHTTRNCSGLKRSIMKVLLSDVSDRKKCSKCRME